MNLEIVEENIPKLDLCLETLTKLRKQIPKIKEKLNSVGDSVTGSDLNLHLDMIKEVINSVVGIILGVKSSDFRKEKDMLVKDTMNIKNISKETLSLSLDRKFDDTFQQNLDEIYNLADKIMSTLKLVLTNNQIMVDYPKIKELYIEYLEKYNPLN